MKIVNKESLIVNKESLIELIKRVYSFCIGLEDSTFS